MHHFLQFAFNFTEAALLRDAFFEVCFYIGLSELFNGIGRRFGKFDGFETIGIAGSNDLFESFDLTLYAAESVDKRVSIHVRSIINLKVPGN